MISRQEAADLLNVSGQTISNWVEKGVLNGHYSCDGRNTMLIDRKSIEKYFDTLENLAFMEKRISLQRKTLMEESDALENDLKDITKAKYLFGKGVPEYYLRDIFSCVLYVAGDEILKEREKQILQTSSRMHKSLRPVRVAARVAKSASISAGVKTCGR